RALPAFADGPDDQRLAAAHVAAREDLGVAGLIPQGVREDVAALVQLEAEVLDHPLLHRAEEAHGEQHEIGLELELGTGDRLELAVSPRADQLLDLPVLTLEAHGGDGE